MSYNLNDKIKNLVSYTPDTNKYRIRLDANESFITPDIEVWQQIINAVNSVAINRYPDPLATDLCQAFADYYGIISDNVTAANGSDELLFIISCCFANSGDVIMNAAPDFSMYDFYAHLAECKVISYKKSCDLEINADDIIKQCNANNAKILIFSNPCNPTSQGISASDMIKIIDNVDALVVADEAYMDFDDNSILKSVNQFDNLIVLRTCSKMIGLAAARVGFAVANKKITSAIRACKSPYNVNSFSQAIATTVLKNKAYLDSCKSKIIEARNSLTDSIKLICEETGWTLYPTKANFLFVKPDNSESVFEFLKNEGILIRNMGAYLRITVGNDQENTELIEALKRFIAGGAL
ncbi:MAG: histidinol-phosphate transaminase [Oscillospiraceae bacterium]|nr:histidinol-phosphate transaminase [Oscillospiraceae bacterium]